MKKVFALIILTISCFCFSLPLAAQNFKKLKLTKQNQIDGVQSIYLNVEFEGHQKLIIYRNNRFFYEEGGTEYSAYGEGVWKQRSNIITINSSIDSSNVPVKLYYFDTDTTKTYYWGARDSKLEAPLYRYKVQVPVNLKNNFLPDSRIYINNDSSYCFPYFDTCLGPINTYKKIKIDFGNGYKTKWIKIENKDFKRLLVVAQTEFELKNYLCLKHKKFKIIGNQLKKIN